MRILSFILLLFSINAFSKDRVVGIFYYSNIFGHLHQNPSTESSSLTNMACGHPVKVLHKKGYGRNSHWIYAKVGNAKGYIERDFLTGRRPKCFQDKYPKFFNALNLDLNELYYWGKLYDHFIFGESKVK
jgi:hypothetical protein